MRVHIYVSAASNWRDLVAFLSYLYIYVSKRVIHKQQPPPKRRIKKYMYIYIHIYTYYWRIVRIYTFFCSDWFISVTLCHILLTIRLCCIFTALYSSSYCEKPYHTNHVYPLVLCSPVFRSRAIFSVSRENSRKSCAQKVKLLPSTSPRTVEKGFCQLLLFCLATTHPTWSICATPTTRDFSLFQDAFSTFYPCESKRCDEGGALHASCGWICLAFRERRRGPPALLFFAPWHRESGVVHRFLSFSFCINVIGRNSMRPPSHSLFYALVILCGYATPSLHGSRLLAVIFAHYFTTSFRNGWYTRRRLLGGVTHLLTNVS